MGRSYSNVIIHIIFHVKSGCGEMQEKDLSQIFDYIGGIVRSMSGYSLSVGGRTDHIHLLACIPTSISMADFIRAVKASSSKWIKGLHSDYKTFSWQEGYGVFSVSESRKHAVIQYINNQERHHKTLSVHDEFISFLEKNGL